MNRKIVDESIHDLFFRKMPLKELKNQKKNLHSSSRNDFICNRKIICQIKSVDKRETLPGLHCSTKLDYLTAKAYLYS